MKLKKHIISIILTLLVNTSVFAEPMGDMSCTGKMLNPIADICWQCIFPITLGPAIIAPSPFGAADTPNFSSPVAICPKAVFPFIRIGLAIGFWEVLATAEVTRSPFCMVSLGGTRFANSTQSPSGTGKKNSGTNHTGMKDSFYHAHWMIYPVLNFMSLFTNEFCQNNSDIGIAYMSEFDPLWNNNELSGVLEPEAILFANPIAQAACIADCVAASGWTAVDSLFFCAGCNGSMYPIAGNVSAQYGGIQGAELITERLTFRLHRLFMLNKTSGPDAQCVSYPTGIIIKSQYRTQLAHPIPQTMGTCCQAYGSTTTLSQLGKEFPISGENFSYLVWRKRNCVLSN